MTIGSLPVYDDALSHLLLSGHLFQKLRQLSAIGRLFPPSFNAAAVLSKASEGTLKTCVYVETTFNL